MLINCYRPGFCVKLVKCGKLSRNEEKMSSCDDVNLTRGLLPLEQAMSQMLAYIDCVEGYDEVPLSQCDGLILAVDLKSHIDVPPFDNSAMDGYAFAHQSLHSTTNLQQVGTVFAGSPFHGTVETGQCVRIMTGAKLPKGCDTVIMQEYAQVTDEQVSFKRAVACGANVRSLGEEFSQGQQVMEQGTVLSPRHIALLASLGVASVPVRQKLKVAIFSTGDELTPLGQPLAEGQIYDSNRYALVSMLAKLPVDIIDYGVIADNPDEIRATFLQADTEADVVISSGGVSVGEADFTRDILQELGDINFWKLAIKPGKPIAFGRLSQSVFFGLPGNPVSAMVTFYKLAKPAILAMAGAQVLQPINLQAKLTHDLGKSVGRQDFQRGILVTNALGELEVTSTGKQSSSMMGSMCLANCFIVLSREQGKVCAGETVTVELFDSCLN